MSAPAVAVAGGGINGAGIAWELARKGYEVTLFERGSFGAQTSSASTKLIHGGIRYLENLQFGLVREALEERAFLLRAAPALVHPIELLLPVYDDSPRSRATLRAGLTLYDALAGRRNIGRHRALTADELRSRGPLRAEGLRSGFSFHDAQTDDQGLVVAVMRAAMRDGVTAYENAPVTNIRKAGRGWTVTTSASASRHFDAVVLALGPWMTEFLDEQGIESRLRLTLVKGSHIVLRRKISDYGFLLQSGFDRRVFFSLPWKGTTLVGTTEIALAAMPDRLVASPREVSYLINSFNRYFTEPIHESDIASTFAGVRPLVEKKGDLSSISRDSRLEADDRIVKVFGGKLTTFMALARRVGREVDRFFGQKRSATEPVF